jgi:hypothetical protein
VGHRKTSGENIKMDVQEVGFDEVEWIQLAQYRDYLRSSHGNTLKADCSPWSWLWQNISTSKEK